MENQYTKEDMLHLLKGKWISTNHSDDWQFEILDDVNIDTGSLLPQVYGIDWVDTYNKWRLSIPPFVWVWAYITNLTRDELVVVDIKDCRESFEQIVNLNIDDLGSNMGAVTYRFKRS